MTLMMSSNGSLIGQAVAAAEGGNFEAAAEAFAATIRLHQGDATLHEQHAQCLMELEHYDAAVEAAERWPEAWLTLARSLLNNGELHRAQQACSRCLELDPSHPEALEDMAGIADLLARQTGHIVGLPGLVIMTDPGGQTGPGCVVWEAGLQLARLLLQLAALQQRHAGAQQPCSTAHDHGTAGTAAACHSCQHKPAGEGAHLPAQQACAVGQPSVDLTKLPTLQGACVLELGAGTGVVGLTAAACGARVTLTDLPAVQPLLQSNIARNKQLIEAAGGRATAAVLDWGGRQAAPPDRVCAPSDNEQRRPACSTSCSSWNSMHEQAARCAERSCSSYSRDMLSDPKWVWGLGADLVFNATQVQPVVQAIRSFLQTSSAGNQRHSCFLLSHKQRHADVDQQLLQGLDAAGCSVSRVACPDEHCAEGDQVCVWLMKAATCITCGHCTLRWPSLGVTGYCISTTSSSSPVPGVSMVSPPPPRQTRACPQHAQQVLWI